MCRGNYKSTFMGAGGYDAVQEILFNKINVHGYFMEYDDARSGGFEPLAHAAEGQAGRARHRHDETGKLESKDDLKRRIDEAARFAPLDQLCLSGQCGFASTEEGNVLTEDEQWAKLRGSSKWRRRCGDTQSRMRWRVCAAEPTGVLAFATSRISHARTARCGIQKPMQRTKPPFRADHVGSFLRTAPIKDARAKREKGEITADALKAVEDAEIRKIIAQAGGMRPEARHRRRVPPLVVALRLPLRPRRHRDEADRSRHPVRRRADPCRAARHRRQDRIFRPPDDRALPVPAGEHARHAEDDDPVADAAAFPLRPRLDPEGALSRPRPVLRRSGPNLRQGREGVLRRRLPLPAVRRHDLGVPLLREGARAVTPARRQSGRVAGEVRRR